MGISGVSLGIKEVSYIKQESGIITKTLQVAKNALRFFVMNQYALAVSIWSYLAIETGAIAIEAMREGYVYDMESCRERLCDYWNNSSMPDRGFAPNYLESRCDVGNEVLQTSYSFMKCLQDLCKYMKSIGEEFYACPKLPEMSNQILSVWDKVCPKKGNKSPHKLSELAHLNKCIKKLCNSKKIRITLDKNILELCETKSVEKLHQFLEGINKSLKRLQRNTGNTDSWTQAGVIGAVVGGVAGIIGGAAGIASTIITYQAARAAAAALGVTVPTLSEGLQNIARTTAETAIAMIEQTASHVGEMVPMDTLSTLHELSAQIEEGSLSYYSVEETVPQKVESGNSVNINEMKISGARGVEAGGNDLSETVIRSDIIKNILSMLPAEITASETEGSRETNSLLSTIYQTTRDSLESSIPSITEVSELTKKWIVYMKNTLPYWQDSFCFYDKQINLFVCRLPLPRHRSESRISFFIMEIHKFFSENSNNLCHYFRGDLWCNWNHFLDLISSKRNVSFFMDKECLWDQFALKVNNILTDMYRIDAIGNCHNETIFIKA